MPPAYGCSRAGAPPVGASNFFAPASWGFMVKVNVSAVCVYQVPAVSTRPT